MPTPEIGTHVEVEKSEEIQRLLYIVAVSSWSSLSVMPRTGAPKNTQIAVGGLASANYVGAYLVNEAQHSIQDITNHGTVTDGSIRFDLPTDTDGFDLYVIHS